MRPLLVVLSLGPPLLKESAAAQQHYGFEEACRNAHMTTGACAPNPQQPRSPSCVRIGGHAFHAEKSSGRDDCIDTTVSPSADAEIFVEMVGLANLPKVNELKLTIRRSSQFQNAIALFQDGARMIVYDPQWANFATAEFYLVLAHEAGLLQGLPCMRQPNIEACSKISIAIQDHGFRGVAEQGDGRAAFSGRARGYR
jgi:hypothetical protein